MAIASLPCQRWIDLQPFAARLVSSLDNQKTPEVRKTKKRQLRHATEVVGVIGIVLSLIYVGYEMRQNTIATRAQGHQALAAMYVSGIDLQISDQTFASLVARGKTDISSLSEAERNRFRLYVARELNVWELAFYNYRDGALSFEIWASANSWQCEWVTSPGVEEVWKSFESGAGWEKSFRAHVNSCL